MASELRTLIDYATGENWDMPCCLYEKYLQERTKIKPSKSTTSIQVWLSTLTKEERERITKK